MQFRMPCGKAWFEKVLELEINEVPSRIHDKHGGVLPGRLASARKFQ
ncbi:MAG TPA: hypothetical protein VJA27_00200 [Patescibacteria group bacterium]|nr:hypothetical protein [Patescibacteria group bacterium]